MISRILSFLLLLVPISATGKSRIIDTNIKSLTTVVNDNWLAPAVMRLNSDDVLNISFDELSHDYHRYIYKLERCEANWAPSTTLFESDWLMGFNNNPIESYEHSMNTVVAYTHYSLQIPNDRCKLKLSGNYRLHVLDEDNDNNEVLVAEFMVTEQTMKLSLSTSVNTDIDTRQSHQQVSMTLNLGSETVTHPDDQIFAVVMQNLQEHNLRQGVKPNIIKHNTLVWTHNRSLIFDAGNEYHKFEILDVSHPTMGIDRITWDGQNYQAYPTANEPRHNYLYDEDANGAFCIRNSNYSEVNTTGEYVWVNYRLRAPQQGDVYVYGRWTTSKPDTYKMTYDPIDEIYTARILQKQGYYNYQYTTAKGQLLTTEGSYYQTENQYQAFIYFKGATDRSWRLTAYGDTQQE